MEKRKKITYKQLQYYYRLFRELMDTTPDVIYYKDRKGRLIFVNNAHAKGLGISPEEVAGKTDFDIFPRERAQRMKEDDDWVLSGRGALIDKIERGTRPDGVDNYVSTTKIPRYNERGEIIGLIGITRDITARISLQRQQEEKEAIEEKLKIQIALNRMKSDFMSVVSHELRTPLAIIKEAVLLLEDEIPGRINARQKDLLRSAGSNIEMLKTLIDDLLDLSRLERGAFRLHFSLVNLTELLTFSATHFVPMASEKGILLRWRIPEKPVTILIDAQRIRQVVSNLITNAIKYTERGGKITIEVKLLEDKIRVGVIDTGMGIAKRDRERLFSRFVQLASARGAGIPQGGLGLGLSIAKELVEQHSGEMWVESTLGVGSRFYFTLPRFFTANNLQRGVRSKLLRLLSKGGALHLVNVLIMDFDEIKRILAEGQFDLARLLNDAIREINWRPLSSRKGPVAAILHKTREEVTVAIAVENEIQVQRSCNIFCKNIKERLQRIYKKRIFINAGTGAEGRSIMVGQLPVFSSNMGVSTLSIGMNKRESLRLSCRLPIMVAGARKKQYTHTVDISQGGVCFLSTALMGTDEKVRASLAVPYQKTPLLFSARIAWIKHLRQSSPHEVKKYIIGMEFIRVPAQQKLMLVSFLNTLSRKKASPAA